MNCQSVLIISQPPILENMKVHLYHGSKSKKQNKTMVLFEFVVELYWKMKIMENGVLFILTYLFLSLCVHLCMYVCVCVRARVCLCAHLLNQVLLSSF